MERVEQFPKATHSREDVEKERQERLARGVTSSEITEDAENYILTTVLNIGA